MSARGSGRGGLRPLQTQALTSTGELFPKSTTLSSPYLQATPSQRDHVATCFTLWGSCGSSSCSQWFTFLLSREAGEYPGAMVGVAPPAAHTTRHHLKTRFLLRDFSQQSPEPPGAAHRREGCTGISQPLPWVLTAPSPQHPG